MSDINNSRWRSLVPMCITSVENKIKMHTGVQIKVKIKTHPDQNHKTKTKTKRATWDFRLHFILYSNAFCWVITILILWKIAANSFFIDSNNVGLMKYLYLSHTEKMFMFFVNKYYRINKLTHYSVAKINTESTFNFTPKHLYIAKNAEFFVEVNFKANLLHFSFYFVNAAVSMFSSQLTAQLPESCTDCRRCCHTLYFSFRHYCIY